MAIRREWLNWNQPCLPQAATWLIDQALNSGYSASSHDKARRFCDLRTITCVLSGQRAGRVLTALLLQKCKEHGVSLIPPRIVTPGMLTDELAADQPVATTLEMTLAWMMTLRQCKPDSISALMAQRPAADDLPAWHELAATLADLFANLAGGRVTCARAADEAERMEMFAEGDRWRTLERVHSLYLHELKQLGLLDPHLAGERMLSHQSDAPLLAHHSRLVLIALVDLNAIQRSLIGRLADRTIALVHAPPELHDRFDDLGCVLPDRWTNVRLDIDDADIHLADRPADQAQEALRVIAGQSGRWSAGDITIGLGDESIVPQLRRSAEWAGLHVRSATGTPLTQSAPYRLLQVVADWLSEPRFANFAAMLRHPDVERAIQARLAAPSKDGVDQPFAANWLRLLDDYFADHLHEQLSGEWLGKDQYRRDLAAVYDAAQRLLAPLSHGKRGVTKPIGLWAAPILEVLASFQAGSPESAGEHAEHANDEACETIRNGLAEIVAAPASLQPSVDAAAAIRFVLTHVSRQKLAEDPRDEQIEMLGWLELHLDLAPALIITGVNEGSIPAAVPLDPFLPDSLRVRLGLPSNAQRYARDAYMLQAIRHSRKSVTLIAGRHSAQNDPLTPSRLLLACDDQALVERIRRMCDDDDDRSPPTPLGISVRDPSAKSRLIVPELAALTTPQKLNVTDFKRYLECPYRFALARLLNLEGFDDHASELDPMRFGNLAHEVLCAFGRDKKAAASTSVETIEKFLLQELDQQAARQFGTRPLPAVRVQLAHLKQRLHSFAKCQAELRALGWAIRHCEYKLDGSVALDIPGRPPMPIHGKVDRIDFNEHSGRWLVIDYKTSESGDSPHKTHHGSESAPEDAELEWKDLQLPLYQHLLARSTLGITGEINLAYVCLPRQSDGAKLKSATWSASQLESAIACARRVVEDIRAGKFEVNPDFASPFDPFARICQTTVFGRDDDESGGDE